MRAHHGWRHQRALAEADRRLLPAYAGAGAPAVAHRDRVRHDDTAGGGARAAALRRGGGQRRRETPAGRGRRSVLGVDRHAGRHPALRGAHARRCARAGAGLLRHLRPQLRLRRGARLPAAGRLQQPHPAPGQRPDVQRRRLRRGAARLRLRDRPRGDRAHRDLARAGLGALRRQRDLRGRQRGHLRRQHHARRAAAGRDRKRLPVALPVDSRASLRGGPRGLRERLVPLGGRPGEAALPGVRHARSRRRRRRSRRRVGRRLLHERALGGPVPAGGG